MSRKQSSVIKVIKRVIGLARLEGNHSHRRRRRREESLVLVQVHRREPSSRDTVYRYLVQVLACPTIYSIRLNRNYFFRQRFFLTDNGQNKKSYRRSEAPGYQRESRIEENHE
jgi:hypothetical protein